MGLPGFCWSTAGCAAAVAFAAWLVRRFSPYASGSGIPHVEAVLTEEVPPAPPRLISVKFFGGVSAIGAGLALGREGPSVQMGAAIAHIVGQMFRPQLARTAGCCSRPAPAPVSLPPSMRRLPARCLCSKSWCGGSRRVSRSPRSAPRRRRSPSRALFLGDAPDFAVEPLAYAGVEIWPLFVALGAVAGLAATLYNPRCCGTLAATDRLGRWPVELRAAVIGAAVGALGWFAPDAGRRR